MVHKPKHKVHSFRGLLADGGQDEIHLERQNLNLAYRIVKFEIMPNTPGAVAQESTVKVYREEQTTIDAVIDFDDTDLLAAAFYAGDIHQASNSNAVVITFDNVLFSRNIYVTQSETAGSASCNYYLEIEEVPVNASTLMQIKLGTARTIKTKQSMG